MVAKKYVVFLPFPELGGIIEYYFRHFTGKSRQIQGKSDQYISLIWTRPLAIA